MPMIYAEVRNRFPRHDGRQPHGNNDGQSAYGIDSRSVAREGPLGRGGVSDNSSVVFD
jgi:hypothetical protein